MKNKNLILLIIILGMITLFLFPNPESNFIAYFGTGLFFIIIIIFLIKKDKRK